MTTTKNELANLEFEVDYDTSNITIKNEEQLKELVDKTAKTYKSMTFTDENIDEAKEARADLNKVAKRIDDKRKQVKNDFTASLSGFEEKMNNYKETILETSHTINDMLKKYDEQQKTERKERIMEYANDVASYCELEVTKFISPSTLPPAKLLTKSAFTEKGNLTKKTKELIKSSAEQVHEHQIQVQNEKHIVEELANTAGLEPYGWSVMIDRGMTSNQVIEEIKKSQARKQEELKRQEAEQKRNEELAEQANEAYEDQDKKRKEPKQAEPAEEAEKNEVTTENNLMQFTLEIRGTKDALFKLNKYMLDNDIEFRKVD